MKPSEQMMRNLRGRRGLDTNDTSEDDEILKLTPEEMVRGCIGWEIGDSNWADRIANWMVQVGAKPENF